MKILVLCKRVPFPLTDGESLRIFNYAKRLASAHHLDLTCLGDGPQGGPIAEVFRCIEILPMPPPATTTRTQRLRNVFRVDAFAPRYAEVETHLRRVLAERAYDVIWTSADMVTSIPGECKVPLLADICDDNVLLLRRELARTCGVIPFLRVLKRMLVARRYSRRYFSPAQACLFVSEDDAASFRAVAPTTRVAVIPNGVDASYFAPAPQSSNSSTIVFEGSMDFQPNADAAVHLCRNILPRIASRLPDVRVLLVGRDPTPEVKSLASDRVEVTGYVDDVRPYLASASVFVCPLRMGAGIKNKVLQAWAMGKPVVATRLSVGGLTVEEGANILVRDDPGDFATAVVELLGDPDRRARLGARARETVLGAYTWEAKARQLETLMFSIADRTKVREEAAHA